MGRTVTAGKQCEWFAFTLEHWVDSHWVLECIEVGGSPAFPAGWVKKEGTKEKEEMEGKKGEEGKDEMEGKKRRRRERRKGKMEKIGAT